MRTPATAHSVAEPSSRSKMVASFIVATYAIVTILPLFWIFITVFGAANIYVKALNRVKQR